MLKNFIPCGILSLVALLALGCGSPAAPSPPSLNLPERVDSLAAVRSGDMMDLTWNTPSHTTDRLPLKQDVAAVICRAVADGPCDQIAEMSLAPGKPAEYRDLLTGTLANGPAILLTYRIALRNHAGKSAGVSNPAYAAAGIAPPALTGLSAEVRQGSVLLSWHSVSQKRTGPGTQTAPEAGNSIRIERLLIESAPSPSTPVPTHQKASAPGGLRLEPAKKQPLQTLVVPIVKTDPGHAVDGSIEMNQHYRYIVERVAAYRLEGHAVEIAGQPSDPVLVATTDIFPPPVPEGLAAVADPSGGAVDLSWSPDLAPDLAGYFVYRRDAGSPAPGRCISNPDHPLTAPAFRDLTAKPGRSYSYSVSAMDQSGNESARSTEVVVTVPRS